MEAMAEAAAQARAVDEGAGGEVPEMEAAEEETQAGRKRKRGTKLEVAQKKVVDLELRWEVLKAKVEQGRIALSNKRRDKERLEADEKKLSALEAD